MMKSRHRLLIKITLVFAFFFFIICTVAYVCLVSKKTDPGEIVFFQKIVAGIYASSLLLAVLVYAFFQHRTFLRISAIVSQIHTINVSNLQSGLVADKKEDAFFSLIAAVNTMLSGLHESYSLQKMFVSNVTHELKVPLAGMMGDIEWMLSGAPGVEEYKAALMVFHTRLDAFNQLSGHLLKLMEVNFDTSRIKFVPLRLDELVWQSVAEMKKRVPGREFAVDIIIEDKAIPDSFYTIDGNMELLQIALINVLDNAAKYSPASSLISVSLYLNTKSGSVIEIRDYGLGMEEKDLNNIGKPFFRAENVKHIQGHGIGMSLVMQVMALHKATVSINSMPKEGTSFRFNFLIK